jgi:deazaflavin-dependent oxidoreductase (nitroreductase family)
MTIDPRLEEQLRQGFKYLNRFMLLMWRLGLGQWLNVWPAGLGRYMVITHTGRKSGLKWRTPVNYALIDDEVYCTAGFGSVSDWYRNIIANPQVEVWLPDGWWAGIAEEVTHPEARLPLLRQVLIGSGFAAYAAGLDPKQMTDEELDAETKDYRVIHIRRVAARTGRDGPGDLAWVWPALVFALLPLLFRRNRKR